MKRTYRLLLVISVIVFLFSLIILISTFRPLQTQTYYASVNITVREGGFDVNGTALTFGLVPVGGSVSRTVIFRNEFDFPVIAKISAKGDITPLLDFERSVRLEVEEEKRIGFSAYGIADFERRFYDGTVTIKIWPARNKKSI